MAVTSIKLQNGAIMPMLGFGTSQGTNQCDNNILIEGVKKAIEYGYRVIDTSQVTHTEAGVGEAINAKIQDGTITRDEVFVITKLWCTDHRREDVIPALKKALQRMRLDYLDLYLIHFPIALKPSTDCLHPKNENGELIFADADIDITETWQGMEDALSTGLTRAIGISSFNEPQIKRLLGSCKVRPMSLHIESNPYFQNESLISFCKSEGIPITGFCPLHKPHRTWETGPDAPYVATDPVLLKIGLKYGKSPQQVALRFQIQRGISILAKTNTPTRMIENMQIFDFQLTDDDMEKIRDLDRNLRILTMDRFRPSREYPF